MIPAFITESLQRERERESEGGVQSLVVYCPSVVMWALYAS